jgi:UDP-glucose 6-dehydrogenase
MAGTGTWASCLEPEAYAVFLAVGTPARNADGHADLSYVYEAGN